LPPFNNPQAPPNQIHVIMCLGRDQLDASSCAGEGTLVVAFGMSGDAEVKKGAFHDYSMSWIQRCLCTQALWYVYSKQHVSKAAFMAGAYTPTLLSST